MFDRFVKTKARDETPFGSLFNEPEEIDLPGIFPSFCIRPSPSKWIDPTGAPAMAISDANLINVSPNGRRHDY